jgi:long-chain acyl-CoA synthetase
LTANHLADVFTQRIENYGDRTALRYRAADGWRDISWRALGEQAQALANALVDAGVGAGDRVGIWSGNRPEWTLADLGCLRACAVSVPIYSTSTARQAAYIVDDAEVGILFVGAHAQYEKAKSLLGSCLSLRLIVICDPAVAADVPEAVAFAEFVARGRAAGHDAELEARLSRSSPDDLVTLIYTSGTTGEPKGVMLAHAGFLATTGFHDRRLPETGEQDVSLCFLPLAHVFERAWTYYALHRGMTVCYCDDPAKVIEVLQEVRPTVMCAVPRFYEKVYAAVFDRLESASPLRRRLFTWAIAVGGEAARRKREEQPLSAALWLRHALADRLVLRKLRAIVGGRMRFSALGGAPLSQEIEEFFHAAGIFVICGYGLTETTATVSCHETRHFRPGTVGRPLPGVEVKISEAGEVLVRGLTVMKGYYRKPKETAEAFADGWLRTGDAGVLEEDGCLRITERLKDLIKTSGGKYVAPQLIESTLGADHYVEQIAVIGEGRKFVSALIVPAFDALERWAQGEAISFADRVQLVADPRVVEFYRRRLDERSADLASYERIVRFTLLPEALTVEGGEITPTLKVRRKAAAEKHRGAIDAMYEGH